MADLCNSKNSKLRVTNFNLETKRNQKEKKSLAVSISPTEFEELELRKRRELIRNASLLIIGGQLVDSVIKILVANSRPLNNWIFDIPILLLGVYILYLLQRNKLRLVSWLVVLIYFCPIINIYLQYGTDVPMVIGFMIPILLGAALLNKWEVLIISTLAFGFTLGLYIVQDGLGIYRPALLSPKSNLLFFTISLLLLSLPVTWFVLLSYIQDRSRRFQLQREWWQASLTEITKKNQQITEALAELHLQRERELELHRAAIQAGEQERISLARNLHDDPLQQLQELSRQLGQLTNAYPQLQKLQESARHTAKTLRTICRNLRPDILENFGLYEALLDLINDIEKKGKILDTQLSLNVPLTIQEARFEPEIEITIYRIAQEALQNALKHAQADFLTIELDYRDSKITLTVKDNGKGFALPADLRNLASHSHYGLIGFYERTSQHTGGLINVFSNPQQGTTIQVSLPAKLLSNL